MIAGGGEIYTAWLQSKLVQTLYLTIEPHLFSYGTPLIHRLFAPRFTLQLAHITQLNTRGTLFVEYHISYDRDSH